jgi:23S rRNA (uracil1939-C5)-methyltransferase
MRDVEGIIARMGGQGHGVLEKDGERYYVPYTVPGDHVAAKVGEARGDGFAAQISVLEAAGPERIEPVCAHFQSCGGCALQHWADAPYRAWKRDKLAAALARRGFETPPVQDLLAVPDQSRRRAEFVARRVKDRVLMGFHEAGSRKIVDLAECAVSRPGLVAALPGLREALLPVLGDGWAVDVKVTDTTTGLDVLITGNMKVRVQERIGLSKAAKAMNLARLSWRRELRGGEPELLYLGDRPPTVMFGEVPVVLPPGGFLQATAEAEQMMMDFALDALGNAKRVADLFSGCGAFALRLAAAGKHVLAADADRPAIAALQAGVNAAGLSGRVTAEARDLERRPLTGPELKKLDALVLDPPRAGAKAQVQQIAAAAGSKQAPPLIVMAACDPASFARDARTLADAGYRLERAVPIDQFRWSPHLEIVSIFRC